MEPRVKLLDCTLRDGGQLLEAHDCKVKFGFDNMVAIIQNLYKSGVDIIELGFIDKNKNGDYRDIALFPTVQDISMVIPLRQNNGQLFSALFPDPDYPMELIPAHDDYYCDIIRVILRYSELEKSLDFCKQIARKGYKVSLQPMVTSRYTTEELRMVIDAANEMAAYALYFVDSYGYMAGPDIKKYFSLYDKYLEQSICVGFHAHNNMNLAFSNALAFLGYPSGRQIIVDSCVMGIGQGAGNLQTELIVDHLNNHYASTYGYESVLEACEIIEKLWNENLWGYSVPRLLSAINKTAYKFSESLRETYSLPFVEINRLLKHIPEEMRHRYTPENTKKLVDMNHCNAEAK
jgi:4-hydroxy 2-oxovalerate aldolase